MAALDIPEPFAWDPSFDVRNAAINDQHKALFDRIRELDEDKTNPAKLTALLELVQAHFKTEEDLFEEKGWDTGAAAAHKGVHDKFVGDAVAATKDGVTDDVIAFCKVRAIIMTLHHDTDPQESSKAASAQ